MDGEVGRARQILLSGVDVNGQNQGGTPAIIACQNGHTECLSLFINHGAQLDKADNTGCTPAIIACQNGHTECLSLLVNHDVDCLPTDAGRGPIHIACREGYFECVKFLLVRGKVDVNCRGTIHERHRRSIAASRAT